MTSSTLKERVQATLKSEDTEGTFELYVTRTPGSVSYTHLTLPTT